ncbi:MAG: hypothetical protein Q4F11_05635 [Eubacteriales bacterium]|nr:hypothetical protein [Eubacteriales bacterium]
MVIMSYKVFFKIWTKYNLAIRNNIRYDSVRFIPLICMVPTILNISEKNPCRSVLITVAFVLFIMMMLVRIRPPKVMYIQPVSKKERCIFVNRAYWSKIAFAEAVYIIASLAFLAAGKITEIQLAGEAAGSFAMLQAASNMSMVHVDNIPPKNRDEVNSSFYGFGEQIAGALIVVLGMSLLMFVDYIEKWEIIYSIFAIAVCVVYFLWFYRKCYGRLTAAAADFESQDRIRRKVLMQY